MKQKNYKVDYKKLIAALNKYWRPISNYEFWHKLDIDEVNEAVSVSGMPKELIDKIWEYMPEHDEVVFNRG